MLVSHEPVLVPQPCGMPSCSTEDQSQQYDGDDQKEVTCIGSLGHGDQQNLKCNNVISMTEDMFLDIECQQSIYLVFKFKNKTVDFFALRNSK